MKTKFDGRIKYKHAEHVAWRKVEKDAVLLDLNTSVYYSLNGVGAIIWERLGAGASPDEVKDEVCSEFDVQPKDAQKHLETFVRELCAKKLLCPASK